MKIGLIDADLLDNGTRHPNLALMKLSGYHKAKGHEVELLNAYKDIEAYDQVLVSKVFSFTNFPEEILSIKTVTYGGSGFFPDGGGPQLPSAIEHHMPDYDLYTDYVLQKILKWITSLGQNPSFFKV